MNHNKTLTETKLCQISHFKHQRKARFFNTSSSKNNEVQALWWPFPPSLDQNFKNHDPRKFLSRTGERHKIMQTLTLVSIQVKIITFSTRDGSGVVDGTFAMTSFDACLLSSLALSESRFMSPLSMVSSVFQNSGSYSASQIVPIFLKMIF